MIFQLVKSASQPFRDIHKMILILATLFYVVLFISAVLTNEPYED